MKRKFLTVVFTAVLGALFGCAQEETPIGGGPNERGAVEKDFITYDQDTSGYLDQTEFCAGLQDQGVFNQWDTDTSGILETAEYSKGIFTIWDDNNNSYISQEEWNRYTNQWFVTVYSFNSWDTDNDNQLSEEEFKTGLQDNTVFAIYDMNEVGMNPDEFCSLVFSVVDTSGNQRIEQSEWKDNGLL